MNDDEYLSHSLLIQFTGETIIPLFVLVTWRGYSAVVRLRSVVTLSVTMRVGAPDMIVYQLTQCGLAPLLPPGGSKQIFRLQVLC